MERPIADTRNKMTMEERIQAFFRQSGGPHSPKIREVLEHHLLYGKDHGTPGYKEQFGDAFVDVVVRDPSMLMLFQQVQRWRSTSRAQSEPAKMDTQSPAFQALAGEVHALREEVLRLRAALEQIDATVLSQARSRTDTSE